MTLATRCPRCMTTFRVVDAQLRQADGWVRCGRCNEVFKALESMVELGRSAASAPSAWSAKANIGQPAPATPPAASAVSQRPSLRARLTAQAAPPSQAHPSSPPHAGNDDLSPPFHRMSQARPPDDASDEPAPPPRTATRNAARSPDEPMQHSTEAFASTRQDALPFARRLRLLTAPMSDEARLAWGALAGFSGVALALQMVVAWHDPIGQRVPLLRPLVEVVCVIVECRIEPPRRLSLLSVESTEFHHLAGSIYRLTTRLRNRDVAAVALPSVDLTMTDGTGQLVSRKVLQPADFGSRSRSIAAGQELTLQTVLDTGPRGVSGYTIELFYP